MIHLLHHSIQEHAQQRPGHPAFRCRGQQIDYGDLFEKSNQLANCLIEFGLPPSSRVGIFLPKCIEMPIATFGILAAGCAYVPIDPASRMERLEYIIKDCGIEVLITTCSKKPFLQKLAERSSSLRVIVGIAENSIEGIESIKWSEVESYPANTPSPRCCENDLAYIMYTSGSTGTPKGLMHTHASGLVYARRSADLYSVSSEDILGNHAPLHFDISTFEFLTGPLAGATTVLIPEEAMLFPASLSEIVEEERLTFWYSVPLALIQLLNRGNMEEHDLSSLRWILFGGEPFPPKYLRELMDLLPNARFCNVYGPAEVNQCTYFHVPEDFSGGAEVIPLGKVWDGALAKVLDGSGIEVDPGQTGELIVHSASMMRGYWNRPDLNEHAYAFEEVSPGFQRHYYKTGDLVRVDSDGQLEFLGRKDRQVKIRGYRLELDEVEAVFASLPVVEEAAAIVNRSDSGDKELLVAVTVQGQENFDAAEALSSARQRLPHYGVPNKLIIRNDFPRTTSGKIDRNALTAEYDSTFAGSR